MAINNQDWNSVRSAMREEGIPIDTGEAFARIEADVEKMIQEYNSMVTQIRELRTALEEPGVSEFQRR